MTRSGITSVARFTKRAQIIHPSFPNVFQNSKPTSHVPIQRRIANRHFTFVPRCQHQSPGFVRQRHQQDATTSALQIFLSGVDRMTVKKWRERLHEFPHHGFNGNDRKFTPQNLRLTLWRQRH